MRDHMKFNDCSADFISIEDPRAAEAVMAMKEFEAVKSRLVYQINTFWPSIFLFPPKICGT